jgi:hypothetical protein
MTLLLVFAASHTIANAQMKFISTNGEDVKLHHVSNKVERKVILYLSPNEVPKDAERIGLIIGKYRKRDVAFITAKHFAAMADCNAIVFIDGRDLTAGEEITNTIKNLIAPFGGSNIKGQYIFLAYRVGKEGEVIDKTLKRRLKTAALLFLEY